MLEKTCLFSKEGKILCEFNTNAYSKNLLNSIFHCYSTQLLKFLCVLQGNHNKDNIEQRIRGLQEKLEALNEAAKRRQDGLVDNSAFLQFLWKTDVVESWIADKETQVRSDDYGRDLSSVQTLLTKQVNYFIKDIVNNVELYQKYELEQFC